MFLWMLLLVTSDPLPAALLGADSGALGHLWNPVRSTGSMLLSGHCGQLQNQKVSHNKAANCLTLQDGPAAWRPSGRLPVREGHPAAPV